MTSFASVRRLFAFTAPKPPAEPSDEPILAPLVAPSPKPIAPWRADRLTRIASLSPFAFAIVLDLFATNYFGGLFVEPPSWLGIPLGLAMQGWILAWAGLGAALVWQTRFPFMATLAFCACTAPSIVGLVFAPAIILIMQNLAV